MGRWDTEPPRMFDIFDRSDAEAVKRARAQSQAVALERKIRRRRNKRSNWTGDRQTLSEIGTLIQYRHRGPCDTDDSEAYLRAAVPWLIIKAGGFEAEDLEQRVAEWTAGAVPRLGLSAIRTCIAEARGRNIRKRLWSAQELGNLLRLSVNERERLRLTRIRPADMTRQQFNKYQRKREAELAKARRAAKGARPREQSKAQLKPWDALGMSRAKFYRMQKAGTLPAQIRDRETNSSAAGTKYLQPRTGQSHTSEQTALGPARKASPIRSVGADGHSPRSIPKIVRTAEPLPPPLPEGRGFRHPDLFEETLTLGAAAHSVIDAYTGGRMPPEVIQAVHEAQRVRLLQREDVAHQIGVSPPQLSNALKGRFGLSPRAAANLKEWLAAA
ncbi:hypothetical protein SAMN02799643_05792 [Methylobacterium sp. UNCCL125]|jgi:hypothetical protein|nr:hypothetical protein SAMN02799643_05792 [Methylobacterium sp. UNCCL125]